MNQAFSQADIDALLESKTGRNAAAGQTAHAERYDFRSSDRIPKEQIRTMHSVHDTFAKSLASSLSAYLRTYVTANLISVEQLSFREFITCLPSPTCLARMRMNPFEGAAILELNPSLAFPLIEVLLGGGKLKPVQLKREMTHIEQQIFDTLLVLILQNLSLAWQGAAAVNFKVENYENEPALLQVLPPNETIVMVAVEIQMAEASGMMNIGIPGNIVKSLRQKFDQQRRSRRVAPTVEENQRMLGHVLGCPLQVDVRMEPSSVSFEDLLTLSVGDVLQFDRSVSDPVNIMVNGLRKFGAQLTVSGHRKAAAISDAV